LLESSAERITSAANSFSIMRHQQQQQQANYPTTSTPLRPAVSPKPTAAAIAERDRKFNNSSPSYSTVSNDSSVGYNYPSSQYQQPTPPPPQRSFKPVPPPSALKPQTSSNGTTSGQFPPPPPPPAHQEEDLYARPRHPDQYYSASSAASTPTPTTPKKTFMKPSEFYSEAQRSPSALSAQQQAPGFTPPKGGFQVLPSSFGKTFGKVQEGGSSVQEEYSHYDSGPVRSEQVFETRGADGSISLRRIFTQQQSSSSQSVVSSSRKVFQQNDGSN